MHSHTQACLHVCARCHTFRCIHIRVTHVRSAGLYTCTKICLHVHAQSHVHVYSTHVHVPVICIYSHLYTYIHIERDSGMLTHVQTHGHTRSGTRTCIHTCDTWACAWKSRMARSRESATRRILVISMSTKSLLRIACAAAELVWAQTCHAAALGGEAFEKAWHGCWNYNELNKKRKIKS